MMSSIRSLTSEKRLQLLAASATKHAIILLDADGLIVEWFAGAQRLLGWTAQEAIGQPSSLFFTPEDKASGEHKAELEIARREGQAADIRWHIRKDGTRFYADGIVYALRDEQGELVGFGKVFREAQSAFGRRITGRQEELDAERAFLAAVLDNIEDGVVACDPDGVLTLFNRATRDFHGLPEVSLKPNKWAEHYDLFQPDGVTPMQTEEIPLFRALAGEHVREVEMVIAPKNGKRRTLHASGRPLISEDGQKLGAVVSMHDITHQRETQAAREQAVQEQARRELAEAAASSIRLSEERFRSLVMATAQIVWTTTPEGCVVEDSPTWRSFTGQSYEEWKGFGWLDAIHPDDREGSAKAWAHSIAGRTIYETEYRLRRADGQYRWTTARGVPILNLDGSIREWVGINTDIHDRKMAEIALRDAQSRLEATLIAGEVATWTWDIRTDTVIADRNLARLFSVSEQDAAGGPLEAYTKAIHPDDLSRIIVLIEQAIRTGEHYEASYRVRNAKGEYRFVIARGKVQYAEDGSPACLPGVVLDVTEQKQAEEELRKLAAHLSEANRRKTEFLATLAHELRNPLAPIRNGLEVLRLAGNNPATAAKVQDMLQRQVNHMVHLIDDLLDVARINSGKVELKRELVELKTVVTSAVETSLPLIEASCHALSIHIPEEPVLLDADPTRLAQILANLLTNAAKYTPKEGKIELSAHRQGQEVVVSVSDNGIGIPRESLPAVFEMFTQVARNLGRAQGGLGIGLSLVHRLVEMHGGTVTAFSPGEGKGSTFTVRLPLAEERQRSAMPALSLSRLNHTTKRAFRVVVADDNVDAAESLSALLQLNGHETWIAHDGHAALKLAQEHQPEVVFLDIGMPGLTGYEVARALRTTPGVDQAILVALTGWGAEHDRAKAREAGFSHHLTKPTELSAINRLLDSLSVIAD